MQRWNISNSSLIPLELPVSKSLTSGLGLAGTMATTSHMFMYTLTIQPPTAVTQAILGQFAGTREQQIVTASGSRLTIHRPDPTQGNITPLFSQDVFGIVRSLAAFRLAGSNKGMFLYPCLAFQDQLSDSSSFPGSTMLPRQSGPLKWTCPGGRVDVGRWPDELC